MLKPSAKSVSFGVIVFFVSLCAAAAESDSIKPYFPQFSYPSINAGTYSSRALVGKVVVLNYWFTTCAPCVKEIPVLNSLAEAYREKDVVFVAPTFEQKSVVSPFLQRHPFKYEVVTFGKDNPQQYFPDGQMTFPMHVVLDRLGHVVYRATSDVNLVLLRAAIDGAL